MLDRLVLTGVRDGVNHAFRQRVHLCLFAFLLLYRLEVQSFLRYPLQLRPHHRPHLFRGHAYSQVAPLLLSSKLVD